MVSQAERSAAVAARCPLSWNKRTEKGEVESYQERERENHEGKRTKGRGKALPE